MFLARAAFLSEIVSLLLSLERSIGNPVAATLSRFFISARNLLQILPYMVGVLMGEMVK